MLTISWQILPQRDTHKMILKMLDHDNAMFQCLYGDSWLSITHTHIFHIPKSHASRLVIFPLLWYRYYYSGPSPTRPSAKKRDHPSYVTVSISHQERPNKRGTTVHCSIIITCTLFTAITLGLYIVACPLVWYGRWLAVFIVDELEEEEMKYCDERSDWNPEHDGQTAIVVTVAM